MPSAPLPPRSLPSGPSAVPDERGGHVLQRAAEFNDVAWARMLPVVLEERISQDARPNDDSKQGEDCESTHEELLPVEGAAYSISADTTRASASEIRTHVKGRSARV